MDFAVPLYLIIIFALFLVIPIMIGVYVYRDAGSRGMNASLWTLIAVLSPAAIGLIIYLLVRSDFKASDRNDKVLGVILVAVVLIPILMVGMLAAGLVNFRNASSSSIGAVDGMRVEDFADNKTVSDWINYCDESGNGIYVLEYQYPNKDKDGWSRTNYIVYRNGLSNSVDVSAMGGPKELFGGDTLKIEYFDSQTKGAIGYHIYQVDYSTTSKVELECYVNGKKTDYHLTRTNDQLLFVDLVPWRNDAVNLYDLRIPYLGDNSGVIRLIKETGVAMGEDFTIELKTDKKPYGLKVIYTEYTMDFDNTIFSPYATELLGLINNLDYVEITDGESTFRLTAEEASQTLGHDVKEFGKTPETLEAYIKSLYGRSNPE